MGTQPTPAANTIRLSTFSRDIYFISPRDAVAILRASNFPSITPSGKRKNFVQPGSLFRSINDALKQIILNAHQILQQNSSAPQINNYLPRRKLIFIWEAGILLT